MGQILKRDKNRNKYGDNDEGDREEDEEEGYTKKENL